MAPALAEKESRNEILERLREKIKAVRQTAPASAPVSPAAAPAPGVTPIPLTKPPVAEKAAPIHTYKSDFAEHIDEKNASVFSVLAAEKDAGSTPSHTLTAKAKNRVLFIVAGMLVLLGIVGIYTAYRWANHLSIVPTEQSVPSLVFADARKQVIGTGESLMLSLAAAVGQPLPSGNVLITYVTTSSTTEEGTVVTFPQPGGVLIRALALPAPDILLRNVLDESTVGVIHAGEETRAFFILRVSSFERTFAGMLEWEDTIATNLAPLYPLHPDPAPPVSTTTATSTPPAPLPPPVFEDDVVASRDVRALRDSLGRTVLLYGYRDKETLVIARDEAAFTQLLERLAATKSN